MESFAEPLQKKKRSKITWQIRHLNLGHKLNWNFVLQKKVRSQKSNIEMCSEPGHLTRKGNKGKLVIQRPSFEDIFPLRLRMISNLIWESTATAKNFFLRVSYFQQRPSFELQVSICFQLIFAIVPLSQQASVLGRKFMFPLLLSLRIKWINTHVNSWMV